MTAGGDWTRTNLNYRRPDICDELGADDGVVEAIGRIRAAFGGEIRSVLDLGCGTGRHAAGLSELFGCSAVGVDIQDGLVDYGRSSYPGVELQVGDLRSVRLGRTFDLVTCLGNSLAYLRTDQELGQAAETFAAHVRPGGVLVVMTLMSHGPVGVRCTGLETDLVAATVEIHTEWDPELRLQTTRRTWRHRDGGVDQDVMERRVIPLLELEHLLRRAGFCDVQAFDSAGRRAASAGSEAYVVATRCPVHPAGHPDGGVRASQPAVRWCLPSAAGRRCFRGARDGGAFNTGCAPMGLVKVCGVWVGGSGYWCGAWRTGRRS
ncbi:class I SAM-dependent methyltransferase, partial [Kribbella sp. NPDC051620]|uniref:class I SAM-dependent methyltransferase n=1 Tax=Kribbella sp. NPDC051620 TaxID=3364120 RepID=UPI0037A44D69